MRVFVAGATGVLGRALVPELARWGHAVRALARSPEKAALLPTGTEVVLGDLLGPQIEDQLAATLSGCQAVLHMATAIPSDFKAPGAWEANTRLRTEGTRRLLAAALAAGSRTYVQQSIVMAYVDGGEEWLEESTPLDTSAERAEVCAPVREMEAQVQAVDPGRMRCVILRGGIFAGPGTFQEGTVARVRAGQEVVAGDGRSWVSLVHVADMARAVPAALAHAAAGSIFNIVDEPIRHGDYVDELARRLGAPPPRRDPARREQPSCRCSNRAARQVLGWEPRHGIWPEKH